MSKTYRWTGTLRRGAAPNTIEGELHDGFGFTIAVTGVRTETGGYEITGIPGPVPRDLWVPGIDE